MNNKFSFFLFVLTLLVFKCASGQLQKTWVKTLYYEPYNSYQFYSDSLGKGPHEIVISSDGTFFVLSNDHRRHGQTIYHLDSLGNILSSTGAGQSTASTITNASNLYATPDSGCIYLEALSFIGTPDFRLLKISKFGIVTTIKSWVNSNGGPQEFVYEAIPNHHNGYYCRIDTTIIDIPSNTILTENRFIVFDNDDYLAYDSLLKRIDISGNTLWSANTTGWIIAHSENSIYLQSDSLRKLDAITGNKLWTKPSIAGNKFDMMRSTEGLVILSGRNVYVMDSSGNIIDSNNISITYQTPTTINSLNDGSILTGGAFINYAAGSSSLSRNYSTFLIKLNQEAKGVVDSTDFFIAGDADHDSSVSYIKDGLFIAAAIGQNTPINQVNENSFTERTTYSELWPEESGCGINYRYADAVMDGEINSEDIAFLDVYYNHRTYSPPDTTGSLVRIVYDNNVVSPGDTITASIILGSASRPTDSIYGFSIEPLLSFYNIGSSFILDYKNGVLGDTTANLNIYYSDRSFSTIYLGVIFCRNDQQNISISGDTIFRISAVLPPSIPTGSSVLPSSCFMIKASGCFVPVNAISDSLFIISTSITKFKSNESIRIFPNPAEEETTILSENGIIESIKVKDISGKTVLEKHVNEKKYNLSTSTLGNGIYIIEVCSNKIYSFQKLVVSHN